MIKKSECIVPEDYFVTFTVEEVAIKFHVGERIIREWISDGTLKAKKIGRSYYVTKASIKEMVNNISDDNEIKKCSN